MVHRPTQALSLATAAVLVAGCGGGGTVSNASPRLTEIPLQWTTGDSQFELELDDYVSDREGATLTYAVTSGGGSFTDDTYRNTFDTMGEYTVEFTVTDGDKTTPGSIPVRVTAGNFVVVREDTTGLLLLDSRTNALVRVAAAVTSPSIAATFPSGRLAYHQSTGPTQQLWLFDPLTRTRSRIGASAGGAATFRASTSDGKIVYTAGVSGSLELGVFNPVTGVSRVLTTATPSTITVVVDAADLVFYEVTVNGQSDVYAYDTVADEVFAVGEGATDEQIVRAMPNGGVLFTRVGAGGEADVFCYRVSTGLVEVGASQTSIEAFHKEVAGVSTDGKVVFTAETTNARSLWSWNAANGVTVDLGAAAGAAAWNTVKAIGAGNEVVFESNAFGNTTESDAYFYDLDTAVTAALRDSTDLSTVLGVSTDGTTGWAFVRPSGTTTSLLAISMVGTPATQTWAAGGTVSTTLGVVGNGDVVGQRGDGTALALFDVSAGTWGTPITGTGLVFAGDGIDTGDFVYEVTASSQTDLSMWDASAGNPIVVSDTTGEDAYQIATADGTILFTRVVGSNTNADLFVFDGTDTTRLTNTDAAGLKRDHAVLGKYTGSR